LVPKIPVEAKQKVARSLVSAESSKKRPCDVNHGMRENYWGEPMK